MARRVAARPNGMTSTGSGKRPSTSTHLVSSAITIMRSDAAATIFSRSSAPPPPLIRLSAGSISSAPSTVRSSRSTSSSVVSGTPHSIGLGAGRFRGRHADDFHPGADPSRRAGRQNASRSSRCRARASCRRAHAPARAPPPAVSVRPYSRADDACPGTGIRRGISSVVLREEQPLSVNGLARRLPYLHDRARTDSQFA